MKPLIITAIVSIALGLLTFVLSSTPALDPFRIQKSFGSVSIVLGLVTLAIALFDTRRKKAIALLVSGMALVLLGDQLPQLVFRAIFGRDALADLREAGLLLLFLGVACVVSSWIILVLDGKTEK